ncbi:HAMP domain-containing sensor histidine kinase [Flammeovirgaceae bacterium SG7u.111]|nr:HAMP domain-containing sensor histidine kinase [Flammeovirgaceae bacterium SG7u.132]WPO38202.1 HAMP domain-containing sensor histidine kinase [Flammeovirgaceae bacterium SG7u.111]
MKYNVNERLELLQNAEPFSSLETYLLEQIAQLLEETDVPQGTTLFRKGDPGNTFYIIAEGEVKIFDGEQIFAKLGKGKIFGEFSLFDNAIRTANVVTLADSSLLSLERDTFFELASQNKTLVMAMTRQLTKYIIDKNKLEKKLRQSHTAIEAKNQELLQINEEKNQLLGIIAHDLRNPLTAAMVVSEMLKEGTPGTKEDFEKCISLINKSLSRIGTMVDRILDLKNLEAPAHQPEIMLHSLPNLLGEAISSLKEQATQKGISILEEIDDCKGKVDHERFRQICENLISNSIKFSPINTQVRIRLQDCVDCIKLIVSDQGPGFSEEDKQKMFGKFQRLSAQPTGGEPSTGLGLSIVKQYVTDLEGKLFLESEEGKGASFIVELGK